MVELKQIEPTLEDDVHDQVEETKLTKFVGGRMVGGRRKRKAVAVSEGGGGLAAPACGAVGPTERGTHDTTPMDSRCKACAQIEQG